MTTISNLGVGSGLDLNTLLVSLTKAESAPLAAIQRQQASFTSKISAYGQLNSALGALQTAAAALAKPALFQAVSATSSANDVLSATALATAVNGSYAVNVTQLAQAQSLAAAGQRASSTNIGDGTTSIRVQFEFGKTTGSVFTKDADASRTQLVDIDPAHSSLADIAKAINAKTTLGVTASIVNDGSDTPFRLVLTSTKTGEASSMRITVAGDPVNAGSPDGARGPAHANIASLLTNDPGGQSLQQTAAAQNSQLTVSGIAVTSATNTVAGAVQDVTMIVAKVGSSTLSVQSDTASTGTAISTFVTAYNNLQSIASKLTSFDASSKSGAVLLGDSTLRNIQVRIRSVLTSAQAANGSGLTTLSQIGIALQKDGTLAIDATKLTPALASKLSGVTSLFSGASGAGGYGNQLSLLLTGFTDADGSLTSATSGLNKSIDALDKQYSAKSERIDATIARYKAQFTQLDVLMGRMNQTSGYLKQQFDAMNNSSK